MSDQTRRELIFVHIDGLVADFLYYDRKEDEDLPRGEIEAAVESAEITEVEIVQAFEQCLSKGLGTEVDRCGHVVPGHTTCTLTIGHGGMCRGRKP